VRSGLQDFFNSALRLSLSLDACIATARAAPVVPILNGCVAFVNTSLSFF
jgi:energy-converting hydrogenase Eha subunit E